MVAVEEKNQGNGEREKKGEFMFVFLLFRKNKDEVYCKGQKREYTN